jgi:hypothetical protein
MEDRAMASFSLRLAAAAGWVAFIGIVGGLILVPTLIAGQPPTAATPLADAMGYFAHPGFAALNALGSVLVAGLPIVPFGLGLRLMLRDSENERSAVMADVGFVLLMVALPVYVVSGALGGALAATANGNPAIFGVLHQLYQLLYNGAADVLEGAWIGAFAIAALLGGGSLWLGWLGLALAASRWIKAFVPVGAVPEAIIPISGVLFVAWFLVMVVTLTRAARASKPAAVARAVSAA